MEEKEAIAKTYYKVSNGIPLTYDEIHKIETTFKNHVVLQYYLAIYEEKQGNTDASYKRFLACTKIEPLFLHPYFHIAEKMKAMDDKEGLSKLLLPIYNKPTLDLQGQSPIKRYQLMEQMRISFYLLPALVSRPEEVVKHGRAIIGRIEESNEPYHYPHLETWKNINHMVGNALTTLGRAEEALHAFQEGLKGLSLQVPLTQTQKEHLLGIDRMLQQMFCVLRCYNTISLPSPATVSKLYPSLPLTPQPFREERPEKIHIGYLSPDFNKNAVGLFLTPLLKYFDSSRFSIYCYYNHKSCDEFTALFMSYPNITWTNIKQQTDKEVLHIMRNIHKLDILFDLIGHGIDNRMELFAMKPVPVIINYLGYPDYTHLPTTRFRIVDNITDPNDSTELVHATYYPCVSYFETLLRIPRCFICYHLFENIPLPEIRAPTNSEKFRLGVFNKYGKFHPVIVNAWKDILETNRNYQLCIKLGEKETESTILPVLTGIPRSQITFLPFSPDLPSYFEKFHEVDICIDTFPYAGTTTTCSSLLMGVPVYTIYQQNERHVSNVSASILSHCGEGEAPYISPNICAYKMNILEACHRVENLRSLEERKKRRERFLHAMNPREFMKDFERLIDDVYELEYMMV